MIITLLTLIAAIVETVFFVWLLYFDINEKTANIHMGLPHAENANIRVRKLFKMLLFKILKPFFLFFS